MSSRMRRPEAVTVPLSRGDWVLLKKRLTAGETRDMLRRGFDPKTNAPSPLDMGFAKALAYLVDWSIADADDKPVVIREQPADVVAAALDALEPESYTEILRAIEAHEDGMAKERDEEKKLLTGPLASEPTSVSAAP